MSIRSLAFVQKLPILVFDILAVVLFSIFGFLFPFIFVTVFRFVFYTCTSSLLMIYRK